MILGAFDDVIAFVGDLRGDLNVRDGTVTAVPTRIITLVSGCVTFLGGFLVVWGAVSLGLAIREQQGGSRMARPSETIAGGAIIIAAAVYFGMLDTSWLPA